MQGSQDHIAEAKNTILKPTSKNSTYTKFYIAKTTEEEEEEEEGEEPEEKKHKEKEESSTVSTTIYS